MFEFKKYEKRFDEIELHLHQLGRDILYLENTLKEERRVNKLLLEHFELKDVKVEAFTQLVSTKPCGTPKP